MKSEIKKQIRFVLEQENRVMSDGLDIENKEMIQNIIQRNKDVLTRLDKECLSHEDFQLIRDANDVYLNGHENLAGCYRQAADLDRWLDLRIDKAVADSMKSTLNEAGPQSANELPAAHGKGSRGMNAR